MPRKVDHDGRRLALVEALFNVATRSGLGDVSYRAVATEAGVPPAQVQYYFSTKAELIDAALMELGRRVMARGVELMAKAGPDPSPEALLRAAIEGSRPVDARTRQDLVLFFLFFTAGISDRANAERTLLDAQRSIVEYFATLIRDAQTRGEVPVTTDAMHSARLVLFANMGLNLAALVGIHSVDEAAATMSSTARTPVSTSVSRSI